MEWKATREFVAAYRQLRPGDRETIDRVLVRIGENPEDSASRRSRIVGDLGEAWIVEVRGHLRQWRLYWRVEEGDVLFVLLVEV